VVQEAPAADLSGDWTDQVRAIATAARAGMLAHRDGARLMSTFYTPGEDALTAWQRFTGLLMATGLDFADANRAADTIFSYVNGFTIEEQARGGMSRAEKDRGFRAGLDLIIAGIKAKLAEDGTEANDATSKIARPASS
jgi:TetR/AcrR family tetracycline transcriptional repressor